MNLKVRDFFELETGKIKVHFRKSGVKEYIGSFSKDENGQMRFLGRRIYFGATISETTESLGCGTEVVKFSFPE